MSNSAPENTPSFGHRLRPSGALGPSGAPPEDPVPPVVPGLHVGRLLGRGGFSSAWLVTDDDGRRFALKIATPPRGGPAQEQVRHAPHPDPVMDPPSRGRRAARPDARPGTASGPRRFPATAGDVDLQDGGAGSLRGGLERELRLLQRFRHEHLLEVHRMVETDQGPGMLAELAPGGSLLALIASRGPLPVAEVVTALAPVAQALAHLHAEGMVHGDVTPGNILFTSEGKPLLGDLGTGRLLGAVAAAPSGTPGFMDPASDGAYHVGVDVFALAAVCWFALTGRAPGPTQQRPPLGLIVPEVEPALMGIIKDCLSAPPDRRPAAEDVARVLLASATPVPVNLVPAVHESVLPELLTRRPAEQGTAAGGGRAFPARRGTKRSGSHPSAPRQQKDPVARTGEGLRVRRGVALLAGTLAAVLLGVGVAVTVGGMGGTSEVASGGEARERTAEILQEPADADGDSDADGGADGGGTVVPDGSREDGGAVVPERAADADSAGDGSGTSARPDSAGSVDDDSTGDASLAARDADPVVALEGLAALRARAFTEADVDLLPAVDVGGSPAMAADLDAVGALADSGRTLDDLSITVRDPVRLAAEEVAAPPLGALPAVAAPPGGTEVALVRATAATSSYTEATAVPISGAPAPLMAAGLQELVFVLWDSGPGWRIHTVVVPPS